MSPPGAAPRRICIVGPEAAAAGREGGSHCGALARLLAEAGHSVTRLVTDAASPATVAASAEGVRVVHLDEVSPAPSHIVHGAAGVAVSHRVRRYLLGQPFEVIHFHDAQAAGFSTVQAKRTGAGFEDTLLTLALQAPGEWVRDQNRSWPAAPIEEAKQDYAERYCAEFADVVLAPTTELLDWVKARGWRITGDARVVGSLGDPLQTSAATLEAWRQVTAAVPAVRAPSSTARPRVSVCVAYYNYGKYLPQLLASLEASDYPDFEVVVVNDGSTDAFSREVFHRMSAQYAARGWRFLDKQNEGIGATRNFAARNATGPLLIFMDADNVGTPELISRLVTALQRAGLDAVTCHSTAFVGDAPPPAGNPEPFYAYAPIGPCVEVGCLENVFGDANLCIRREVFEAVQGFSTDRGTSFEDWEFLAKVALAGHRLDVVPLPLFFYRHIETGFSRTTHAVANHRRVLRAYAQAPRLETGRMIAELLVPLAVLHRQHPPPGKPPLRHVLVDRVNDGLKSVVPSRLHAGIKAAFARATRKRKG